jgi:translation initiation factor eIF-2B subunit delta
MHPAIATVRNVGSRLLEGAGPEQLALLQNSLLEANERIARHLRRWISPSSAVITLSNSSTVRDVLVALGVHHVAVLQSLPGGEGREMATALREQSPEGVEVSLIPDAAMGNAVPGMDCALVGIDTFDDAGNLLHKVGTLPLALCCRHFGKRFFAAGHSLKHRSGSLETDGSRYAPAGFFDRTPAALITALVTEQGAYAKRE